MLYAAKPKSRSIERVERKGNVLLLYSELGMHRLCPVNERVIRITYTQREKFSEREKPGVITKESYAEWSVSESDDEIVCQLGGMSIAIDRKSASYAYYGKNGELLLRERARDSKCLEEFTSYRLAGDETVKVEKVQTADGVKEYVTDAARVPDEKLYHTRLHLEWQEDEALYGLGQQEEGILNLRGQTVYLHQANRKIAVPMLLSTAGYGLLMDTYSPMIFNDNAYGSYLYTEADDELDYYFIAADDMNDIVKEYRSLTGKAAMLPKWAFGYVQSQERYESADELLQVTEEYRRRGIGLDCIVLDWCSWEDGMWGQKSFDPKRFPDPAEMIRRLHEQNVHFMISIWPNMDEQTKNYREMKEAGKMLPACGIYNALDEEARALYWKQAEQGLFRFGVDAWWCDSSEPITVEWSHVERMEPAIMYTEYCRELQNHLPAWATNAFCLYHSQTLYEGQRAVSEEKRVCNLTRSAYTGQQRYGAILWSGDTAASWATFRAQISSGLNFCASGLPYWTTDIGAFFVKKSTFWYWDGDFDDTVKDAGYLELYTRWFQWGSFLPVFRGHGTDCRRELWEYQGCDRMFYDAMLEANRLRYRLMPYIYSQAGHVWKDDASMIKPLVFDFKKDAMVCDIRDQYMFGDSLMICPVTEAMYYAPGNVPLQTKEYVRKVYLPAGCGWYDFWSDQYYEGGQWITADAPIERIPVFVKEGSILPMAEATDCVEVQEKICWKVYSGRDCAYELYQDAGDGYAYERGEYTCRKYTWSEKDKCLKDESGSFVEAAVVSR